MGVSARSSTTPVFEPRASLGSNPVISGLVVGLCNQPFIQHFKQKPFRRYFCECRSLEIIVDSCRRESQIVLVKKGKNEVLPIAFRHWINQSTNAPKRHRICQIGFRQCYFKPNESNRYRIVTIFIIGGPHSHANDCQPNRVQEPRMLTGPKARRSWSESMQPQPHDRARKYDAGPQRTADSTNRDSDEEQARRIEQRRVILEDGTLPHEIRRKAHERMCQLKREGGDE